MSNTSSPFPAFMRRMTPEKFKALSTAEQIAYRKKSDAWLAAFDAQIEHRKTEDNKQLAHGIAELVKNNRSLEAEIVQNYIRRESKYLVDRAFFDANPRFDEAYAAWELQQLKQRKSAKQAVTTVTGKARGKRAAAAADRPAGDASKAQTD